MNLRRLLAPLFAATVLSSMMLTVPTAAHADEAPLVDPALVTADIYLDCSSGTPTAVAAITKPRDQAVAFAVDGEVQGDGTDIPAGVESDILAWLTFPEDSTYTVTVLVNGSMIDPTATIVDQETITFNCVGDPILVGQPSEPHFQDVCGGPDASGYDLTIPRNSAQVAYDVVADDVSNLLEVTASARTGYALEPQVIVSWFFDYTDAECAAPLPAAPSGQLVYRFWSPRYQTHFFTISLAERNSIILGFPASTWTYEGAAYEAYEARQTGTVPLYRFYSANLGGHFYTTSETERAYVDAAFDDATWRYEGIAYYVYPLDANVTGTLDVARFWSPANQHHFYTASTAEAAQVRAAYPARIWTFEGLSFRVPSSLATPPPPPTPPVVVPPVVVPPVVTPPANPGDSKNCSNFRTYAEAKAWFDTYFPYYGDIAKLDGNNDGIPCENLPGAPK